MLSIFSGMGQLPPVARNTTSAVELKKLGASVGVAFRLTMAANVLAGRHHNFSSNHLS